MATCQIRDIRSRKESQTSAVVIEVSYILLGVAPGILWLLYFFIANRNEEESFASVFRVFCWAATFTIPTAIAERLLNATIIKESIQDSLITSFLLIAPIEEFFKLLAVWIGAYRRSDFRAPIDGITYAITAALGFVVVENALYILRLGPSIVWSRLLYATPGHLLFSALWGYSMGMARFVRVGEMSVVLKGFLCSVGFHGLYNLLVAISPGKAKITLAPLLMVLFVIVILLVKKLRSVSPYPYLGDALLIICPECEAYAPEAARKCRRCGFPLSNPVADTARFCWKCRHKVSPDATRCPRCYVSLKKSSLGQNEATSLDGVHVKA